MAKLGKRGSQMPAGRVNPSRPRTWDPALHPRNPFGMFAKTAGVGGGKPAPKSRARGSSVLDEQPNTIERAMAARAAFWANQGDELPAGGLSAGVPAAAPTGWDPVAGRPIDPGIGVETWARQRNTMLNADPSTPPHPVRDHPNWDDVSYTDVGRARGAIEADILDSYTDPKATPFNRFDPNHPIKDLSDGGAINDGVSRGILKGSGTEVVVKNVHDADEASAEFLAAEVGHVIGAPSPVVVIDPRNHRSITMEAIPGMPGYSVAGYDVEPRNRGRFFEQGARIALQDQLTGNIDRHGGNWILTDDDQPVGIDNGYAFRSPGGHRGAREMRDHQIANRGSMVSIWATTADEMPAEEIAKWSRGLHALRPTFQAHGKAHWHDQLMENFTDLLETRTRNEEW